MVATNVEFFDKATANTGDYVVPWNRYDAGNLPLELKLIKINKPGQEPILYVKPVMKKLDGGGDYADLVIMTGPSRILFPIEPFDDKIKHPFSEEDMTKVYESVPPGGSKSFDLCLEPTSDALAFCKAVDVIVKSFVLGNVDRFPNLIKAREKGANLIFYPSVIERKAKADGGEASTHLKTKLFFKDGEFDIKAFDSDKNVTSLRANRTRLPRGKVSAVLKFGSVWTNVMGGYGASWKAVGGFFEFAANAQKPATCDDLFRAFSEVMGKPMSSGSSSIKGPSTTNTTLVDDVDEFDDDDDVIDTGVAGSAAGSAAASAPVKKNVTVVESDVEDDEVLAVKEDVEEEDDDEEDDDEEEDDEEDDDDEEAIALAAETKRKEEEAAAAAAAAAAAKVAKAAKKSKTVVTEVTEAEEAPAAPVVEKKKSKSTKAK